MKRHLYGISAIIIGLTCFSFNSKNVKSQTHSIYRTDYYFIFVGTHGQESDETKWDQTDQTSYNLLSCPGSNVGCKLKTTATFFQGKIRRPAQVVTDADGTPTGGLGVTEIDNKD